MKKKLIIISVILIFILSIVFVQGLAVGVKTGSKEKQVNMYPPEIATFSSPYSKFTYTDAIKYGTAKEGFARIDTDNSMTRPRSSVELNVKNLKGLELGETYEVWIIDVDSGYSLTLGLLDVDYDGDGDMLWSMRGYINEYDKIVITKEPIPDSNPGPSGEVVLVGDLDLNSLIKNKESQGDFSKELYADLGNQAPGYQKRHYDYGTY
jgi:hypothetical protein